MAPPYLGNNNGNELSEQRLSKQTKVLFEIPCFAVSWDSKIPRDWLEFGRASNTKAGHCVVASHADVRWGSSRVGGAGTRVIGSITSRCSGKWAHTHPPERGGSKTGPGRRRKSSLRAWRTLRTSSWESEANCVVTVMVHTFSYIPQIIVFDGFHRLVIITSSTEKELLHVSKKLSVGL